MKNRMIKIGAYLVLISGIAFCLLLIIIGIALFLAFPDANLAKKLGMAGIILIIIVLVMIFILSIFDSMIDIVKMEYEMEQLMRKRRKSDEADNQN